jgi:hypothetical protein
VPLPTPIDCRRRSNACTADGICREWPLWGSGWHNSIGIWGAVLLTIGQAAVFTEHSGYVEFDQIEDSVVADSHKDIYRQR